MNAFSEYEGNLLAALSQALDRNTAALNRQAAAQEAANELQSQLHAHTPELMKEAMADLERIFGSRKNDS